MAEILDLRERLAKREFHSVPEGVRESNPGAEPLSTAACTCRVTGNCSTCQRWDSFYRGRE
jgi:hypothetical protein